MIKKNHYIATTKIATKIGWQALDAGRSVDHLIEIN